MIETPKQLHEPKIDNVCMNAILNQQLRITTCTVPPIYMLTSRCMSYTQAQNIRCAHTFFFIFLKTSPPLNLLLPSSPKSEQIHV